MIIVNRKKFVRGILIIIAIVSLFICKTTFSFNQKNYKKIYVTCNDTLWEIANDELANNDYYKGKDVREVIDSIKNINNLNDSKLYEGQILLIATN